MPRSANAFGWSVKPSLAGINIAATLPPVASLEWSDIDYRARQP
jgi:hypothetical protein